MPLALDLRLHDCVEIHNRDGLVGDIKLTGASRFGEVPHSKLGFDLRGLAVVRGSLPGKAKAELIGRFFDLQPQVVSKDEVINTLIDELRILRSVAGSCVCVESESTDSILKFVGKKV